MESISDSNSVDLFGLLCATIPDIIKPVLKDTKISYNVKKEVQAISDALEREVSANVPELQEVPNLTLQTSAFSAFDQMSPVTEAQTKDSVLGLVIHNVCKEENQRAQPFQKLDAKTGQKYLLQFN